ncbi:MAG: hypothetical protein ACYDB9_03760 [Gammaproteobacteria bacterium]
MRRILLAAVLLGLSTGVFANNNINNLPALTQSQFLDLSTDLGAIITYKQLSSTAPEGLTGFDVGFDVSATNVAHASAWNTATGGSNVSTIPMASLRVSKGLPFGFDVGGFYTAAPNTNIKAYGGDIRYAILDGGALSPAVGIRAAYSRLTGVNQLSFDTKSLDLSISKGFGPFTPYAGIGRVWVNSDPGASTGLSSESFGSNEAFVGLSMSFVVMHLALEADRIAGNSTYSVKLGFGF